MATGRRLDMFEYRAKVIYVCRSGGGSIYVDERKLFGWKEKSSHVRSSLLNLSPAKISTLA